MSHTNDSKEPIWRGDKVVRERNRVDVHAHFIPNFVEMR